MTEEEKIVDFATVRDLLKGAQERRRDLTYEQRAALFHAEWAASENRGGIKTSPETFASLFSSLAESEKLNQHPEVCAKIAELMPMKVSITRCFSIERKGMKT